MVCQFYASWSAIDHDQDQVPGGWGKSTGWFSELQIAIKGKQIIKEIPFGKHTRMKGRWISELQSFKFVQMWRVVGEKF